MTVFCPPAIRLMLFLVLLALPAGCTYIAAVSQTNVPVQRSKEVSASTYKFNFLGFNFDNDEILRLATSLRDKCPDGDVRGILTKDTRIMYFLFFFWARETTATGYCLPHKNMAHARMEESPGDNLDHWATMGSEGT